MKSFDKGWEEIHASRSWGTYPSEHVIRFVARNFYKSKDRTEIKILDFGCGAGAHTWYLSREGFDAYAFDGSESAVKRTLEMLHEEGYKADVICADALELPYETNFFDAIIDNVSIQANTVQNIDEMYMCCNRILKKGGKLFTSVFGKSTTGYGSGKEIEKDTFEGIEIGKTQRTRKHFFEKDELKIRLVRSGFSRVIVNEMKYTDGQEIVHLYYGIAEK